MPRAPAVYILVKWTKYTQACEKVGGSILVKVLKSKEKFRLLIKNTVMIL